MLSTSLPLPAALPSTQLHRGGAGRETEEMKELSMHTVCFPQDTDYPVCTCLRPCGAYTQNLPGQLIGLLREQKEVPLKTSKKLQKCALPYLIHSGLQHPFPETQNHNK